MIGEPQREQNTRSFPGVLSKAVSTSSPAVITKSALGTAMIATNAPPCAFWH